MRGVCGVYRYASGEPVREQLLRDMPTVIHYRGPDDDETEAIAHLYEDFGAHCIHQLQGMFAFAVGDVRRRCLLLARDRLGIKPLYSTYPGQHLVFGSEIKAILPHPKVQTCLDLEGLNHLLSLTGHHHLRQIGHENLGLFRPVGAPTCAQHYRDVSQMPHTRPFGIDPKGPAALGVHRRNVKRHILPARQMGRRGLDRRHRGPRGHRPHRPCPMTSWHQAGRRHAWRICRTKVCSGWEALDCKADVRLTLSKPAIFEY